MRNAQVLVVFRAFAAIEALTWAGLLVGMFFKRVVGSTEIGVEIFGPLHGVAFIAYVVVAAVAWWKLRWTPWTGIIALAASIPPLGTVLFERVASVTGHIDRSAPAESSAPVS